MAIVWRDEVLSSYNGNLESVLIHNAEGTETKTVPNGVFVTLHGLADMGREVKEARLATDATKEVLLVHSPEVVYDGSADLEDFENEAGDVARAFRLSSGDVITLTEDLIEAEGLAVGTELTVGDGGKLTATVAPTDGETAPATTVRFFVREDAGYELTRKQKAWRIDIVK